MDINAQLFDEQAAQYGEMRAMYVFIIQYALRMITQELHIRSERKRGQDREAEWEELREVALRNRDKIQGPLPISVLNRPPPRIVSPFEMSEVGEMDMSNGMDTSQQSFSSSVNFDAADEIAPHFDEVDDQQGNLVWTTRLFHLFQLDSKPYCRGPFRTRPVANKLGPLRVRAHTSDVKVSYRFRLTF